MVSFPYAIEYLLLFYSAWNRRERQIKGGETRPTRHRHYNITVPCDDRNDRGHHDSGAWERKLLYDYTIIR